MMIPVLDSDGNLLKIGQTVAFNYSGDVIRGTVKGFKNRTKYGRMYVEVHILHVHETIISKIQNNRSILIIKDV